MTFLRLLRFHRRGGMPWLHSIRRAWRGATLRF